MSAGAWTAAAVVDVRTAILEVKWDLEEIGTAATAPTGSLCWVGRLADIDVAAAVQVVINARGAVRLLEELWHELQRPGLVNALRRLLMRRTMLRQLLLLQARLEDVRVGHHPRWGALVVTVPRWRAS